MGKDNQESAEQPNSENKNPSKEEAKQEIKEETEEKPEDTKEEEKKDTPEENNEKPEGKKEDVEKLRKVIKVDDNSNKKDDKKPPSNQEEMDISSRDGLEQKRAILQSIKDFDFQIKKNQEELTGLNKKLDSVTRDLDDLVSLYEIVSEQMNPFVGLSKVTKKRIDALENFTSEIDNLKDRMNEIESFAERTGANIKNIKINNKKQDDTTSEKINLEKDEKEDLNNKEETEEEDMEKTDIKNTEDTDETKEEIKKPKEEDIKDKFDTINKEITPNPINENVPLNKPEQINYRSQTNEDSSFDDLDRIIEESLYALSQDMKIDRAIDNFIENLKMDNIN